MALVLYSQSLSPVTYLLQQGHTSQASPNSATNWRPSIRIPQTMGGISHANHKQLSKEIIFVCLLLVSAIYYLFILEVSLTMLLRLASDFTILPLLSFQVLGLQLSLTLCINGDIHPQINVQQPQ